MLQSRVVQLSIKVELRHMLRTCELRVLDDSEHVPALNFPGSDRMHGTAMSEYRKHEPTRANEIILWRETCTQLNPSDVLR
jgi:hypothetical protein